MKGLIIYYLSLDTCYGIDEIDYFDTVIRGNKAIAERSEADGYPIMYITVSGEKSHIEKYDFFDTGVENE